MSTSEPRPLWEECWDALRLEVCSVCLDSRGDGECGLPRHRVCYLKERLPEIVEAVEATDSTRMDEFYASIESRICSTCRTREADGRCPLRFETECALFTYLPLVVDAVKEIRSRR